MRQVIVGERENGGAALSRRRFLALSAAGLIVAALPGGPAAAATEGARRFSYRGSEVRVEAGAEPRIVVDGEVLEVIDSNGAYRAAGFMYSPQATLEELGERLVDNHARIAGGL